MAGAGQKPAKAWADLLLCLDPAAFLTARLGRLAWCKVGDGTPPDPPEPPDPDPPPAPRPQPPSPPAADVEPPPGHPAWDRPPVEDVDGWEPLEWDDAAWPAAGAGAVLNADALASRTTRASENGAAPVLVCDVPWLHPEVPAYSDPSGGTALLCPYCGRQHRHGGFGHRLAHCADPQGRGYVLVQAGAAPPWAVHHAPAAAPDMELRR